MIKNLIIVIIVPILFFSCDRQKEIEVKLPPYATKPVVECYLEPGKPFQMALTESVSYFESPSLPTVDNALVIISYGSNSDTLKNIITSDNAGKFYNYSSTNLVPFLYNTEFSLYIKDKFGRIVTSKTIIPEVVPIDNVEFRFNKDSMAFPLVKFSDDLSTVDFYRYVLTRDSIPGDKKADYLIDDVLFTTSQQAVGSSFEFIKNDHLIVRIYHITKAYYDFLLSAKTAADSNGNPFGQPSLIKSDINGGIGVFTGLSYSEMQVNVP